MTTTDGLSTTYSTDQIMITLASIAYIPYEDIATNLANTSYATQGQWKLVWGPCIHYDDFLNTDNLVYIVYNSQTDSYAVAIRGSRLTFAASTFFDLWEDLAVLTKHDITYPGAKDAWIASGTQDGLDAITGLQDGNHENLLSFLQSRKATNIYVTGHSLGGCLTTVLAPYLLYNLGPTPSDYNIMPFTFAAPTAGNEAFATWYDNTFPNSVRWYNTNDAVPMAWNNLDGLADLFDSVVTCPGVLAVALRLWARYLHKKGFDYTQTNGNGNPFTIKINDELDWYSEVSKQHNHLTYLKGLKAPSVPPPDLSCTTKAVRYNADYEREYQPDVLKLLKVE